MSDLAIKVENVSKLYRLGDVGTGTLGEDITRFWAQLRGKEDPFSKLANANDRSQKSDSDFVWSLRDIDFEVKKGDAVGIIGRNGAGKSTLLKILSRITAPTTGNVRIDGRIASLLEVGTGFSPDLTGRQNIYMNGAILGMTRAEVSATMDEIIDFSGVEAYIDTPVKRYSSGMYVRLAFAVAAHLDPEIMIVDEVLAVGDAEFQKKCLGKMQDVNKGEGRTVLFVSHNMAAINTLCNSGIILKNGEITFQGGIEKASELYLATGRVSKEKKVDFGSLDFDITQSKRAKITSIELLNDQIYYLNTIHIEITIESGMVLSDVVVGVGINTLSSVRLITVENLDDLILKVYPNTPFKIRVEIPKTYLAPGSYILAAGIRQLTDNSALDYVPDALQFEVETTPSTLQISEKPQLGLRPESNWSYLI